MVFDFTTRRKCHRECSSTLDHNLDEGVFVLVDNALHSRALNVVLLSKMYSPFEEYSFQHLVLYTEQKRRFVKK